MKNYVKRLISAVLCAAVFAACFTMSGCSQTAETVKIGVLREDDTSGEAVAWQRYLETIGGEMGFTVEFVTTDSSSSEVSAINTFASKGFNAIMLFSDDDAIASINAAADNKMFVVCPTGHPTDEQYEQLKNNAYYLGSSAPTDDTEYQAGYDMARYFVEEKGQTAFTVFGGATLYGSTMHVHRLAGMLSYLCEDKTTSYDGATERGELAGKVIGTSVDPAKFKSSRYRITGYMDGFAFDDAFSTKLTSSLESGGTCVLTVGAGDTVSKIAYGITSASGKIKDVMVGGVDAITSDYAECFALGYTYDCGKFASAMAPGIIMILSAVQEKKIVNSDGFAPKIGMNYWVATSVDELNSMLASDNATDGYCYNKNVIDHYVGGSYGELVQLCGSDYEEAVAIHGEYNK